MTRGNTAFARADAVRGDAEYRQAVRLAGSADRRRWLGLVVSHLAGLQRLGAATRALQRCAEYLDEVGGDHPAVAVLWLLRAEIRSSLADHSGVDADVVAIRTALRSRAGSLTVDDLARLSRVAGLSAADRGDAEVAAQELDEARRLFLQAGNQAGVQAVDLDKLALDVRQGDEAAVAEVLSDGPLATVSDRLLLAVALKRQLRYEEALNVVQSMLDGDTDDIEPMLRFAVLWQQAVLFRLLRDDKAAEQMMPSLREAAAQSPDPAAAAAALTRLSSAQLSADGEFSDAVCTAFDRRLAHARRLILSDHLGEDRLAEAGRLLDELHQRARTERDLATWYLAAGELLFVRGSRAGYQSLLRDAVRHLDEAVKRASATSLAEVRVDALRLRGRSYYRLSQADRAVQCWAEAHQREERIAGIQITDAARMRMLQAVPDEYDERIQAATEALGKHGVEGAAPIVVAMEAARGAAILGRILPDQANFARELPAPNDLHGAWRWVAEIGDRLPRSQVVWLMHATPYRVHHAIVGREFLHHASVATARNTVTEAIDALMACWSNAGLLEESILDGSFTARLQDVAAELGLGAVFPDLPAGVSRIVIVAGDALADIPFAAMTLPGSTEPIGLRFALSDLPCLSARRPLAQRARQVRGDTRLLVSPPDEGITPAAVLRGRRVLDGPEATRAELGSVLALHRHRQVRIDCHGQHDPDDPAQQWWLQLVPDNPDDPDGRLTPEQLQWMDLHGCGTLALGACESGMAQRRGRDERIGFVRAAMHAGAAAVVAARWIALDEVAAVVLDGFDSYVRYLPRDVALQRALLDVCRGVRDLPATVPDFDHPARWACWTLYGDSGWQTGAGPVRRALRRIG